MMSYLLKRALDSMTSQEIDLHPAIKLKFKQDFTAKSCVIFDECYFYMTNKCSQPLRVKIAPAIMTKNMDVGRECRAKSARGHPHVNLCHEHMIKVSLSDLIQSLTGKDFSTLAHKSLVLKKKRKIRPVPRGSYTLQIDACSENCKTK